MSEGRLDSCKKKTVNPPLVTHHLSLITRSRKGQAMLEYVLALAALLVVITVMGYVVTAAEYSAERTNDFVRADYP